MTTSLKGRLTGAVKGGKATFVNVAQVNLGTASEKSVARSSDDSHSIEWNGQLLADMAVGGPGGLQTGSAEAPDTWYQHHIIADTSGVNTPKALFIPEGVAFAEAGYNVSRRLGWVRNSTGSNLLPFDQYVMGSLRRYYYDLSIANRRILQNGAAVVYALVDASSLLPPGCGHFIALVGFRTGSAGAAADRLRVRFPGHTAGALYRFRTGQVNGVKQFWPTEIPIDSARKFEYRVEQAGVDKNDADFEVVGFDDEL